MAEEETTTEGELVQRKRVRSREQNWRLAAQRNPTPRKEDVERVNRLRGALQKIMTVGSPWKPETVEQRRRSFVYPEVVNPARLVVLDWDQYQEAKSREDFPKLSLETMRLMEKDIRGLWLAIEVCPLCGRHIPQRTRGKLFALLDGRAKLPRTDGRPQGSSVLQWKLMHDECAKVFEEVVAVWADLHKLLDQPERHSEERRAQYQQIINSHWGEFTGDLSNKSGEAKKKAAHEAVSLVVKVIQTITQDL